MVKLLISLMLLLLISIGVSADIVSESCEKTMVGNSYQLNCFSDSQWIQDSNGVWQDFNKVVEVNFRNREIFVEWNENTIELNPFVIYNGNQYYTQQIPDNLWEQVNWRNVLGSERGFFKFALKLKRIGGISAVGFDINSNLDLTEYNAEQAFGKFGRVGIGFRDLIDAGFCLEKRIKDNNVIEVKITCLPNTGEDWDLDPIITQTTTSTEELKKINAKIEGFWETSYTCLFQLYPVEWQRVDASNNYEIRSRADFDTTGLIPSNGIVEKIEVRQYVYSDNTPVNQSVEYRSTGRVGVGNCATGRRFNSVGDGTLYATKNGDEFIIGQYTDWFDLGGDAITEFDSHLEYFVVGTKVKFTTTVDDTWNGRIEWIRSVVGQQPELRITYSIPIEEEDELIIEDYLKKRTQWFPIFIILSLFVLSVWWVLK